MATDAPASAASPPRRRRGRVPTDADQTVRLPVDRFCILRTRLVIPAFSSSPRRRGSSITETPENDRDATAYWIVRSSRTMTAEFVFILTPAPCPRRRPRRWLRRLPPPAAASPCAPCRRGSSGSTFPAPPPGNRTTPDALRRSSP